MAGHSEEEPHGLRGSVRRAVGGAIGAGTGAIDATVDRVSHTVSGAALDVTGATAQQVIEELEPYLIEEAIPRIVAGITPYLTEDLIPEVLEQLQTHLIEVTVPQILAGLMPQIEEQVAPQLVDSLMPKIRADVVPDILEDIVDDPAVRDLIREQSQGLFLDALESVRENLADVDNTLENTCRRLVRRPVRPEPESGLVLVLDATRGEAAPARATLRSLAQQRREWQAMPVPPAPPGREFAYAGALTRVAAFAIDVFLIGWIVGQGLAAIVGVLDSLFNPVPAWLVAFLSFVGVSFVPIYLGVCWWLTGRSIGSWLVGTRVCTADGRNLGFGRALVRAWLGVVGIFVWLATGVISVFDIKRRSLLDRIVRSEVRYVVPGDQQHRYIREALEHRKEAAAAANGQGG